MKNTIQRSLLILLVFGGMLSSCKKDFLNTRPLDQVPASDTWKDAALSEAFVNGTYAGLGVGGFEEQMMASISDEAIFTHAGRNINIINEGILNPSNTGWLSANFEWANMYNRIRNANVALENLPKATFEDKVLKDRLQGEALFLRAYFYQQLLRFYGGVPLVSKTYGLNEDYSIARSSYADCVTFIVKDLDAAAAFLKGKPVVRGRASEVAALALKARVLLYAASDLHDMNTVSSDLLKNFAKKDLLGYVGGDRKARWQAAKDAAKAVLDLAGSGYKTDLTAPVSFEEGRKNYISMAMGGGSKSPEADPSASKELLFERTFSPDKTPQEGATQMGLYNGPNGYHNWSGNSPIEELVSDYEMMDGTSFNWSNPVHKADPYVNREPRFYATILYDGATWKPRDKISGNVDPANQIQTGVYKFGSTVLPGLDTRQSTIESWNGSWTGYYFRKFTDPDPSIVENTQRQYIPWPFLRYTEMMFNYAEASIELGLDADARTWLNKIRFRAGMPAITESGDALKQRFRHEKRIEMAYEEQRVHDTRRWMIPASTIGRKTIYINVEGTIKPGEAPPVPYRKDKNLFNYTYTPVENNTLENRKWDDKAYYRPISLVEINRNSQLVQNPGY